jgi:guanyl-specific ribonuclease Sa
MGWFTHGLTMGTRLHFALSQECSLGAARRLSLADSPWQEPRPRGGVRRHRSLTVAARKHSCSRGALVRVQLFLGALAWLCLGALGRAHGEVPYLLTAQGSIERVEENTLTLKPRTSNGRFSKNLVLKLTGTSRLTALGTHKRSNSVVIAQKELRREDLKPRQGIAVIYTTEASANILLTAIVQLDPESDRAPDVPAKVLTVLKYIDEHKTAPPGYEGGRTFLNLGRDGEETLPRKDEHGKPIRYHEWDVNPHVPGRNRGPERLVTGSDGSAYYTADHYRTYMKIR